jgi:hypothetical protein
MNNYISADVDAWKSYNSALDISGIKFNSFWKSQVYNIGQRFNVKKLRLSFPQGIAEGITITPSIIVDDNETTELTAITSAVLGSDKSYTLEMSEIKGFYNFILKLQWSGTRTENTNNNSPVGLPIYMEVEVENE